MAKKTKQKKPPRSWSRKKCYSFNICWNENRHLNIEILNQMIHRIGIDSIRGLNEPSPPPPHFKCNFHTQVYIYLFLYPGVDL